ncbi:deoxyuridine 5'-triphosphate nucleotidohydrolase-like [Aegilops tauschii subsp. strangulata]|uniref:deoxyuridine 5'-triphosphate nucleotidohydrolase-like n=1 Tax=Aegilops tauschii subsp. strangulata TaxID=200361 RepID=UPI00098A7A77|nr:deoxyuridine 5'-triphosphate nucleotidohydrolase-like [Aegilops tauschii subsp. strangulata]
MLKEPQPCPRKSHGFWATPLLPGVAVEEDDDSAVLLARPLAQMLHSLGVIDADYRGPVGLVLFNHSEADFAMKPGGHITQMILQVIATLKVAEVEDLDATVRGEGGFGSIGV